MTRTPSVALAALAAALALPRPSLAFDWTARAGLEYDRTTSEVPQAPSVTVPRLDVDLALDAGGSSPGILDWGGGVQYRRTAVTREDVDQVRDQLSYRLRSVLFSNPRSPVTLTGHASRVEDDFSTDGAATGSLLSSTYGGALTINGVMRPRVEAGYTFTESEQENPLIGVTERTLHSVDAAAGHGAANYTIASRYRGTFGEGTYAFDNFDDHRVDVDADITVAPALKFRVSDTYYLRHPTTESPFNPRHEVNSLSAALTHVPEGGNTQTARYYYVHGLQEVPGTEEQERSQQRVAYSLLRVLPNPEWRIRGDAEVAYAEDRLGDTSTRAAGQSLGTVVYWRRERDGGLYEVRGGPTVGVLEPDGGDPIFGYGGSAGVSYGRSSVVNTHGSYELSYASDLHGLRGWSLRQYLNGTADGRLGRGALVGTLQASSERRELSAGTALGGSAATRSISASIGYRMRKADVTLRAGLQDGLVGTATGDGLLFAPPFDSHVRFATLAGSLVPWRYVTLRGYLRTSSTDLPDRAPLAEQEAYGALELAYGALRFAVEDRYVISEVPGGTLQVNRVLFRVSRVLGSRY